MRILGLDFGTKTTGVAVSDPMGWTAQGLEIIRRQEDEHLKATLNRIAQICTEYKVEKIVLGLPKNTKFLSIEFLCKYEYKSYPAPIG